MKKLLITTQQDTKDLMAKMYIDIGKYSFQNVDEGILIKFDEVTPESLQAFLNRFSDWFIKESFVLIGDSYFKGHQHQERWEVWKRDFRFLSTYQDTFYRILIKERLEEFLFGLENQFPLEVSLQDLLDLVSELANIRMQLVEEHFDAGAHEDYIMLYLGLKSERDSLSSN